MDMKKNIENEPDSQEGSLKPKGISKKQKTAIIVIVTCIAFLIRLAFFSYSSRDYVIFLRPWFDEIRDNGGFSALGLAIGDYLPTYIYILTALTYLPLNSLYSIKLISFAGDIILGLYAMRIVNAKTRNTYLAVSVYAIVMFLPTVILNSGVWGQCDSIYTAALIACIYYMLIDKPGAGMISYSISFIFKLQAVFLAPFILLMLIKKKIRFVQLFYVPAAYLLAILPAVIAGRSIQDLLSVYFRQTGTYNKLSLGAPNFYAFMNPGDTSPYSIGGICLFVVVMAIAFIIVWRTGLELTSDIIVKAAMLSLIIVPFMLPHMHERYFYAADVFSVIYAALNKKRWFLPVIICGSSLSGYSQYLYGYGAFSRFFSLAAIPMFIALCIIIKDMANAVHEQKNQSNIPVKNTV